MLGFFRGMRGRTVFFSGIVLYWHQMKNEGNAMARKTYTEVDRGPGAAGSGDTGMNIVCKGLRDLRGGGARRGGGDSKPYFYSFFGPLEDFSLQMMEEQLLPSAPAAGTGAGPAGGDLGGARSLFPDDPPPPGKRHPGDDPGGEADLHSRLTPERFQDPRPGQRDFFLRLMGALDIRQEDCAPEVLANLVFSCLLIYNSAPGIHAISVSFAPGGDGGAAREIFGELSGLPAQRKKDR